MGQREVLTVHEFSVLSKLNSARYELDNPRSKFFGRFFFSKIVHFDDYSVIDEVFFVTKS